MEFENALEIAAKIVEQKRRWGKHYQITNDYPDEIVGQVIMALAQVHNDHVPKEELTKAHRQLAAAKAREGALRKQMENLKANLAPKED